MSKLQSKIMGGLVGASAGDAMGAATELRTIEQSNGAALGFSN